MQNWCHNRPFAQDGYVHRNVRSFRLFPGGASGRVFIALRFLDYRLQDCKKPLTMRAPAFCSGLADTGQQSAGMFDFAVAAFFGLPGGMFKRCINLILGFFLQIDAPRQGLGVEALIIILRQSLRVGYEPGFHALRHKMHLILLGGVKIPFVTLPQVRTWQPGYRRLRIHQQDVEFFRFVLSGVKEGLVRLIAATTAGDGPAAALLPRPVHQRLEKRGYPQTKRGLAFGGITSTFEINGNSIRGSLPIFRSARFHRDDIFPANV